MHKILLNSLVISLAACVTPSQQGEYIANHIERTFGPTCAAMGYEPGTDKYRDCKLSLYNADTQRAGSAAAGLIK